MSKYTALPYLLTSVSILKILFPKPKCFDVESVFTATVVDHEAGANETEVHAIAELVVSNLLKGYCIGEATIPSPDDFVDAVFDSYATGGVIPEEGDPDFYIYIYIFKCLHNNN